MKTVLCLLLLYSVNLCLAGVVDDGSALLQSNLADLSTDDSCIATGAGESSYKVSSPATLEDESLGADMGEAQVIEGTRADEIEARLAQARDYMHNVVYKDEAFSHVRDICVNKHSLCAFWAIIGECENNPGYMQVNCAPVCQSCEQLHVETRCPLDPNAKDALEPGDLNKMFERIISDPDLQQYEPVVLSRPSYVNGDTAENATYQIGIWMVMFENALSAEEAERMIELGDIVGRERSADVGDEQKDGTFSLNINPGRTSTNAVSINLACDPMQRRLTRLFCSGVLKAATRTKCHAGSCSVWRTLLAFQRRMLNTFSCCATKRTSFIRLTMTTFLINAIVPAESAF